LGMGRLGPHVESQLLGASQDLNPALVKVSIFKASIAHQIINNIIIRYFCPSA